ncbi:MAG: hypothetical protein ACLTYN_02675 [Dysosmobacter welbionis]
MKQIEKEGYAWARMGIDTQAAADAYLRTYAQRQGVLPQYEGAAAGDRPPRLRRRSTSSPGRRWALARRPWPWPMTKRC